MKLNDTQLSQVDAQIKRLVKTDSYYGKKYRELGITDVTSQEAFEELPFSSKDDLRNAYPLGIQAVPDEEVVRIHSSSGTTGKPVIIPYTAKDVDDWATMFARCYETAGVTKKDRVHITPGYGLWTAGIGFQAGAEKLGAMVIPMGPGNTDKQLQMMIDLESTVLTATSSYALLLKKAICLSVISMILNAFFEISLQGACIFSAWRRITSVASARLPSKITGTPSLIIPAFSKAIFSIVSPRIAV